MIQRDQHYEDPEAALRAALDGLQVRIWTDLPCYVESWDADANTVVLQPAIKGQKLKPDGTTESYDPPQLIECPIIWPQGGSFILTFPLAKGDEVIALIACRNIGGWYQSGGGGKNMPQVEPILRLHDLSDGFCLAGVRSKPRAVTNISTTSVQLRHVDGDAYVELTNSKVANIKANGGINLLSTGDIKLQAGGKVQLIAGGDVELSSGANFLVTANDSQFTGQVHANGIPIDNTHTHGGVTTGAGSTAVPNP